MQVKRTTAPERGSGSSWRERGACISEDPELFFPTGVTAAAQAQTDQARAVCARCPVAGECLTWALASGEQHGVWGGLSAQDRRAIMRSRSVVARRVREVTEAASVAPAGGSNTSERVA